MSQSHDAATVLDLDPVEVEKALRFHERPVCICWSVYPGKLTL